LDEVYTSFRVWQHYRVALTVEVIGGAILFYMQFTFTTISITRIHVIVNSRHYFFAFIINEAPATCLNSCNPSLKGTSLTILKRNDRLANLIYITPLSMQLNSC
jgi:hypothetical protein